jgi:hypothetical protein
MSESINEIVYNATKTAAEFHNNRNFVIGLFGPVGCGKSVACLLHLIGIAMQQEPGNDGVRRTRFAIIRNTYPELKATTIASWLSWFPEKKFGKVKWDSPITHSVKFKGEDDLWVETQILFMSLDSDEDIKKLKSLEVTAIYINEAQFINYKIFVEATGRVDRYPPKIFGAKATWAGLIFDCNPPDTDHWIYKYVDSNRPSNYSLIKYKPAVIRLDKPIEGVRCEQSRNGTWYTSNPEADYKIVQSNPEYWIKQVPGRTDEQIKVDLMGEYGIITSGKPVHPAYNDNYHYANKELQYAPSIELGLGWDFGLTPAVALMQLTPRGQLLCIDELWSENMSLREFVESVVVPHLDMYYLGWRGSYLSVHDPAGNVGSQTDGRNCADILREFDITSNAAADNNNPTPRRDGLDYFLGKMVDGMPAFLVSEKCRMIRKGLMGSYQYAKVKVGGADRYHEKPLKNMYSHICEAAEYIGMHYAPLSKKPVTDKKPYVINTRGSFFAR